MKSFITLCIINLLIVILVLIAFFCAGCNAQNYSPIPDTPQQRLTETVLKTNWLATVAIIGIAASAFAFLNGSKTGIAGMVACFIALSMTLATARYASWLAAGGLIGSLGLMIYSVLTKDRALKEIVQGGQKLKEDSYPEFQTRFNIVQKEGQSESTRKLVKRIKETG